MKSIDTVYIKGQFVAPYGTERFTLVDPVTEQTGPGGPALMRGLMGSRHESAVNKAIGWIREHYDAPLRIADTGCRPVAWRCADALSSDSQQYYC